jgi:hypothetical protein
MTVLDMTVREINRAVIRSTHVMACYETTDGQRHVGRIIRAKTQQGMIQGKVLATGTWCRLVEVWTT